MQEIRFHGRGGLGAVLGSEVLAHAFFLEGKYVQAFPQFGVERRGAPVTAFCRVDDEPILLRCQIYEPDHVVVLDDSLVRTTPVTQGLKPEGSVIINGRRKPDRYAAQLGRGHRIFVVDATSVAAEQGLGSPLNPIVNTAILGAIARVTGAVSIESVAEAIEACVPARRQENIRAARVAYERTS
jgi:2-oxoacid:acceptor oxidoreductase gamma subunit (pyruvate/2-ketoisovalerate family)